MSQYLGFRRKGRKRLVFPFWMFDGTLDAPWSPTGPLPHPGSLVYVGSDGYARCSCPRCG